MTNTLAAVIPYFQTESGILSRALRSALEQSAVDVFPIVIVDDGFSVPAEHELAKLNPEYRGRIEIVRQPNAGPAAARNAGLDMLHGRARFVAFLDSDDEWAAPHIGNALCALNSGSDFYFSDSRSDC